MALGVPSGLANLLGLGDSGKSWEDRLREAAYTTGQKGTRIKFLYEDVSQTVEKRGTVFEFPGVDDGYVQQKGFGPRQYPLRCFFGGNDHDRVATAFLAGLLEPGVGQLEHPLYGKFKAVPFGTITRRDDLKTAANQSIVEVTFWSTLLDVYPSSKRAGKNEIEAALGDFDVVAAQKFSDDTSLLGALKKRSAIATLKGALRDISAALRSVSDTTALARRQFDDTFNVINFGLDVLVGQPLLLARQISGLINAPARAIAGIQSRLDGYAALAASIFGSRAGRPGANIGLTSSSLSRASNDFQIARLMAMASVGGGVLSTLETEFTTKPEALAAAERVTDLFDDVVAWSDGAFDDLGGVDTGESYQALLDAVSLMVGFLIEVSFQLVPERRIVLDRPRTIVDLSAELYGAVDSRLDLLIASNNLTGDEILELPAGRSIAYYPS